MRIVAIILSVLTILAGERVSADSSLFNGIQQNATPDLVSIFGSLTYNVGTDALQIQAFPENLNIAPGNTINPVTNPTVLSLRSFLLNAVIPTLALGDLNGIAITGTLDIDGTVASAGFVGDHNSNHLLRGNVTAFRSPSANQMEFLFTITGGDAATLFGGINHVGIVVIPDIAPAYDRFFNTTNLTNDPDGLNFSTDTASASIVPEPGSFLLAVFGIVGIAGGARLRRQRPLQA